MRRRTRRMSGRRPLLYTAVLAALLLLGYLHGRVAGLSPEGASPVEMSRGVGAGRGAGAPLSSESVGESVPSGGGEVSAAGSSAGTALMPPAGGGEDAAVVSARGSVYRTGWAELPAERRDGDLYYVHHLCGGEGETAGMRNYSACFSVKRRCPVWVAAPLHGCYRGGAKRTGGYSFDPSLPLEVQPSLKRSYGEYTRGHLLASAARTVSPEANRMTFTPANIAPQIQAGFNAAGGAWNNLEELVDGEVCEDTLYVVTGCLFADYDDPRGRRVRASSTRNRNDGGVVAVPTAYYKVLLRTRSGRTGRSVAECGAEELKCAAFVVGHYGERGREPSAADIMSVAELERLAGETFFANVPAAPKERAEAGDWGL